MTDGEIPFACVGCNTINKVSRDVEPLVGRQRVILTCGDCGCVNEPQEIRTSHRAGHEGENYLACIKFTGPESKVPTGYVTVGGRTLWTDADGKHWTSEEFIQKFGTDPVAYWTKKIRIEKLAVEAFNLGHPVRARPVFHIY